MLRQIWLSYPESNMYLWTLFYRQTYFKNELTSFIKLQSGPWAFSHLIVSGADSSEYIIGFKKSSMIARGNSFNFYEIAYLPGTWFILGMV